MGGARRLPVVVDAGAAVVLAAGALLHLRSLNFHAPTAPAAVLAVVSASAVGFRRTADALATTVAVTSMVAYQRVTHDQNMLFLPFAVILCIYSSAARLTDRRGLRRIAVLLGYGVAGCAAIAANTGGLTVANLGGHVVLLLVVPALIGLTVAWRWSTTNRLRTVTAQLRVEHEIAAYRAIVQERNRVARDVHDVVAHGVSVMVIQASGARLVASSDLAAAQAALAVVAQSGREALAELRRVVGMLHTEPVAPGLARVVSLVDRLGPAGLATLSIQQAPASLDLAVEVVVYRLVQEALTNVLKHAPRSTAHVALNFTDSRIDITVENAASAVIDHRAKTPASGHGLAGMRERVLAIGGQVQAGPSLDGGWRVHASLPLDLSAADPVTKHGDAVRSPEPSDIDHRWLQPAAAMVLVALLVTEAVFSAQRRGSLGLNLVVVVAAAAAVLLIRVSPLLFLAAVETLAIPISRGLTAINATTLTSVYVMVVPLLVVATLSSATVTLMGLTLVTAVEVGTGIHDGVSATDLIGSVLVSIALCGVGRVIRSQRQLSGILKTAIADLSAQRADRERIVVAEERSRIVRALDWRVADDLTAMLVQAEAAFDNLAGNQAAALEAIESVETTGRQTLAEMRNILGTLRAEDPARDLQAATP